MKKILSDAAAVGNATGRMLNWRYAVSHPDWAYYPGSKWGNMLWEGGAFFETPPPTSRTACSTRPRDRRAHARLAHGLLLRLHDGLTGHDHADPRHRLAVPDGLPGCRRQPLRRRQDVQGHSSQGHPRPGVLVVHAVRQPVALRCSTRRQRYPRAGSQNYPSPAAKAGADGSTAIYFGPTQPAGVDRGNWIQTMPGKGWFTSCACTARSRRSSTRAGAPSEIELVK